MFDSLMLWRVICKYLRCVLLQHLVMVLLVGKLFIAYLIENIIFFLKKEEIYVVLVGQLRHTVTFSCTLYEC